MLNRLMELPQVLVEAQSSPYVVRYKKPLLVMLGAWMTYFLLVNGFVHSLNKVAVPFIGLPLGTYLTIQGAAIVFAAALFCFARPAK